MAYSFRKIDYDAEKWLTADEKCFAMRTKSIVSIEKPFAGSQKLFARREKSPVSITDWFVRLAGGDTRESIE